ncbi:MAG: hypothetical protein J4G04_07130 [Nitrosopumilaceae archaeon]|nr:hypothetical protein [Nitrosopumilaceae archaeon]
MRAVVVAALSLAAAACLALQAPAALAHTTVSAGSYEIEVGWGLEPPVVGIWNTFVFHVTEPGEREGVKTGVINAFRDMSATATFGGVTKTLEVNSDPRPGYYFANVIPTRTGSYSILLEGEISGTAVNVDVPIEDMESTALLDFPPSGSASDRDVEALRAAVTSLQAEVDRIASEGTSPDPAGGATYDVAVMGVSLGAVAVVLGVLALVRRPRA